MHNAMVAMEREVMVVSFKYSRYLAPISEWLGGQVARRRSRKSMTTEDSRVQIPSGPTFSFSYPFWLDYFFSQLFPLPTQSGYIEKSTDIAIMIFEGLLRLKIRCSTTLQTGDVEEPR